MKKIKEWMLPFIVIGIIGLIFYIQNGKIQSLTDELNLVYQTAGVLREDVVSLITFDDHILTKMSRVNGTDTVVVERVYIPVESTIEYITTIDTVAMGKLEQAQILLVQLEQEMATTADSLAVDSLRTAIFNLQRMVHVVKVEYDSYGGCTEPCLVGGINSNISGVYGLGVRLLYVGRFGAGLQATIDKEEKGAIDIFGDYRIPGRESLAPYGSFGYNLGKKEWQLGAGAHIYF